MSDRVKLVYIGEVEILSRFSCGYQFTDYMIFKGLPKDCLVKSVFHDHSRRAFAFMVSHPEFEEVPPGHPAPEIIGELERIEISEYTAHLHQRLLEETARRREAERRLKP